MATSEEENANGVIIRIYVESTKTRSRKKKKKTEEQHHVNAQTHHHRHALLLAHSQYLRKTSSENVPSSPPQPIHESRPIIKTKVVPYQPVRICSCSPSMETIPSLTILARNELKEKKRDNQSEKRNSTENYSPSFLGKMKNLLKQLSCKEI